jgi:hypothetical protein
MEFFLIYLFVMAETLAASMMSAGGAMIWTPVVALGVSALICLLVSVETGDTFEDVWGSKLPRIIGKVSKFSIPVGILFVSIATLIPTQQQLAIIVGSGVTYNVLTSEPAKQIGGKALELLNKKIDEALEEGSEKEKAEQATLSRSKTST